MIKRGVSLTSGMKFSLTVFKVTFLSFVKSNIGARKLKKCKCYLTLYRLVSTKRSYTLKQT